MMQGLCPCTPSGDTPLSQGLCPCTPSGDTSPEPHALWRGITCREEYEKNDKIYHI